MLQTRSLLKTVTSALLIATLSHAALLPASLDVSMQSENMRHILKWSSLQEACSSVNYTVLYQGEFEYMQNNRWQDEPSCTNVVQTECDLTLALSSDSDYNVSVLARCDDATLWARLPKSFNRRDTVLLAPKMDVYLRAGQIEVYLHERQSHININLKIWKKGDEQNAFVTEITGQRFHHDVWQDGGVYCLRAEAVLDLGNKSNSTETRCVRVQEPEPSWLVPLAAGVAVTLTLTVTVLLGLMTPRCSLRLRKSMHKKEALPTALLDWSEGSPIFSPKVPQEPTHSVLLLDPSEEQDRRGREEGDA